MNAWQDVMEKQALPVELVRAVVQVESGGDAWAWNPEPRYAYLWDVKKNQPFRRLSTAEAASGVPPRDFPALAGDRDQEWWGQRASWGLMQIMGAVAREQGFSGPYLTELCQPVTGIDYACRHLGSLARRCAKRGYGWYEICAAYNGGMGAVKAKGTVSNPAYPDKVLAALGGVWPKPYGA